MKKVNSEKLSKLGKGIKNLSKGKKIAIVIAAVVLVAIIVAAIAIPKAMQKRMAAAFGSVSETVALEKRT